jgi:hypothetical protein
VRRGGAEPPPPPHTTTRPTEVHRYFTTSKNIGPILRRIDTVPRIVTIVSLDCNERVFGQGDFQGGKNCILRRNSGTEGTPYVVVFSIHHRQIKTYLQLLMVSLSFTGTPIGPALFILKISRQNLIQQLIN